MDPIITRVVQDSPTVVPWQPQRTNILVELLNTASLARVYSDGFEYWIKWCGDRAYIDPVVLGVPVQSEVAIAA